MKAKLISLLCLVLMSTPLGVVMLATPGCSSTSIAPGHDPVVVEVERDLQIAHHLADGFLRWEQANRAFAGASVTRFADDVREKFPGYYDAATATIRSYKRNRSPENKARLETAIAVLNTLMVEVLRLLPTDQTKAAYREAGVPILP